MSKTRNNNNSNNRRYPHQNPYNILPSPAVLDEYESISQGSVDKLLDMAKKEQDHRHVWQEQHLHTHAGIYRWGQIFAFTYNVALLLLIGVLVRDGNKEFALKLFIINALLMTFALLVTFIERRVMNRRPPRRIPQKYNKDNKDNNKRR